MSATLAREQPRLAAPPARGHGAATLAGPAALALGLCAVGITARSLGFDEAASVSIASQHGAALWRAIAHDGGNMSGYYLLLHAVIAAFGRGLLAVRAPSAVAAAATVALTAAIARRRFGDRVALIAGLLAAVSLPLVFWGQSARGYAPMVAFATGSFCAFDVLSGPRAGRGAWWAYCVCTTLAAYCGFVAVLIVPAQLLALAGRPRAAVRRVGSALLAAAVGCTPLVVLAATRGSGQLFWVPRPTLTADRQVLDAIASAGFEPSFHAGALATVLLCLTGVILVVYGWRRRAHAWLYAWLAVPLVLAWLESLVGQPLFLPRNLLVVLPAVALLLALALTDPRLPRVAGGLLLAALLALRAVPLAGAYGVSPEDWRSATAYVLARAAPGDCIAFYPSDAHMAFAYYVPADARAPRSVLPRAPWRPLAPFVEDYATLSHPPLDCPRLWLVSSHAGQPDGPAGARANLARFTGLRAALGHEYREAATATFGYAATVTVERFSARSGT